MRLSSAAVAAPARLARLLHRRQRLRPLATGAPSFRRPCPAVRGACARLLLLLLLRLLLLLVVLVVVVVVVVDVMLMVRRRRRAGVLRGRPHAAGRRACSVE